MFDARDIAGRVKRQAQNGVVLLKPHDFYIDASIRSSIFCYGTRPARHDKYWHDFAKLTGTIASATISRLSNVRETRLHGLHVLHFGEHDVGGALELVRCLFQLRGALRKAGLVVRILE